MRIQAQLTRKNPEQHVEYLANKAFEDVLLLRSNLDAFIEAFKLSLSLGYPLDDDVLVDAQYMRSFFEES